MRVDSLQRERQFSWTESESGRAAKLEYPVVVILPPNGADAMGLSATTISALFNGVVPIEPTEGGFRTPKLDLTTSAPLGLDNEGLTDRPDALAVRHNEAGPSAFYATTHEVRN